jgi:hypothetical protein
VKLCVLQQLFKLFKLRYLMGYELWLNVGGCCCRWRLNVVDVDVDVVVVVVDGGGGGQAARDAGWAGETTTAQEGQGQGAFAFTPHLSLTPSHSLTPLSFSTLSVSHPLCQLSYTFCQNPSS